jgi:hypothetical protein
MDGETIDFIEVERLDGNAIDSSDSRIDSGEFESIHRDRWISSGEVKHRLRMDQSAFVRAISTLVEEHQIPQFKLRRGKARNTEYSEITISLVEALESGDDEALERLKAVIFNCGRTEEVNVVAPVKFKQNADAQMAISDSRIIHLRQAAELKLIQLQQLCAQWKEAEEAEEIAQQKDLEAQQAQWDLECLDEVMREKTYKRTRKREIQQILENGVS